MKVCDHELFFKYFRMNPTQYENLLKLIAPAITKSSIKREVIGHSERLSVTLRYLSTGDPHVSIGSSLRISPTSIGRIINETSHPSNMELSHANLFTSTSYCRRMEKDCK